MNIEELRTGEKQLKEMRKLSKAIHKCHENACNGWPKLKREVRDGKQYVYQEQDDKFRERDERRLENLENRAYELACEMELVLYIQTDPRGGTIYLLPIQYKHEPHLDRIYSSVGWCV